MNMTFWLLMYFIVGDVLSIVEILLNGGEECYRDMVRTYIKNEHTITAILIAAVIVNMISCPVTYTIAVYFNFRKGGP